MSNWQDISTKEQPAQVPGVGGGRGNWIDLPAANVRPAAIGALTVNPEKTAQDYLLAERYKTTPSLVGTARSIFEERAAADDAAHVMSGAPKFSGWYTKAPENAALAKGDLQNSANLEGLLDSMRPELLRGVKLPELVSFKPQPKIDGSTWDRTKRSWVEGQIRNRIATHGFIQMPLDGLAEIFPSLFGDLAETNRDEIKGYREWIKNTPFTDASGITKVWEDFVRSSPLMATQISLGILSGGVATPTTFMGTQISGSQYAELTEDGVNGGRAFFAALGNTAMQLPMEAIQMSKFTKLFKSSGLGQIARNVGETALTSFVTETLQNYPDALTTLWALSTQTGQNPMKQFLNNLGQYTMEGMYEGALSIPWALLGGGGRIAYDIGRYKTLNRDVEFFSALDDNAAASKIKARLPQAYQSLVDHLTVNGPVQSLYIDPAAMRAAIQDENVLYQTANDMGVSNEQFNRAEELGADIEVPLNLYQGKIAGTDVSLALRGEVRTSPEGMTLTEQAAFTEKFHQQVQSAVAEYRDSLLQDDDLNTVLAPIENELTSIYGKEGARANVALLLTRANMAAQAWSEAGRKITPTQWLQEVAKLRVAVREQGQGQIGDLQHAAMYRSRATTPEEFVAEAERASPKDAKSFFHLGTVTRQDGLLNGAQAQLGSDQARHIRKRHPIFSDWDGITSVLEKGKPELMGKNRVTGDDAYVFILEGPEKTFAVMAAPVGGKKGNRAVILTAFKDTPAAVRYWVEEQKRGATFFQSAENTAYPSDQEGGLGKAVTTSASLRLGQTSNEDVLRNQPSSDKNIATKEADVNGELHSDIRGSISFQEDETLISLFKDSADFSTFVHEIGHLFVRDMENLVATGAAPQQVIKDLESLKAFTAEFSIPETLRGFYDSTFRTQRPSFREKAFSSLSESELALVRSVAEQEKLADAFVTYISEGKAPSAELRPVFQRFCIWLQKLYQALSDKVAINDEIRGVFDRMLASDQDIRLAEQIHQAQAAELQALDAVAANMLTEQEYVRLQKARSEAAAVSREHRLRKVLKAYYRAGVNRKEIRRQAAESVNAMPVYAAQEQAIAEGGLNSDAVRDEYGVDIANALLKKRPGLLRKEGTVSLQDLAVAHGFTNEEALIDAIRNAPGKKAETNALVQSEIAAHEEAIRKELGLDEGTNPGDPDYYSDQRLNALELEARALSRSSGEHGRGGRTFGTAETLRKLARRMLEFMPYRETSNIGRLSAAEAKQATRAAQAVAEGDVETAADAKRRQAITHAMVMEALQYRHEADVFTHALKRHVKSARMVFEYQEQIRALAQRYNLAPGISPRKPGERSGLKDFIDNATADSVFDAPPFSDFILSEQTPENMTLGELREVRDVVRWLAAEGNPEEARLLSEGTEGTVADTVKTGVVTLRASGNKYIPKLEGTLKRAGQDIWQDVFGGLDHIKFMMMAADGYKEVGKHSHLAGFHSQWFGRVMEAQTRFLSMFRSVRPELDRIAQVRDGFIRRFEKEFGKRALAINGVGTPEVMREVGRTHWTAEHIWCLARNMGNAGNLKTLHQGLSLTDTDLRALTAVLSRDEWLAIQAEGDLIGKHFAESDKIFRQIYGRPMPDKVEPLPMTVDTAEGDVLDLPGWYFPISVDGRLNPEIGDKQEINLAKANPDFVAYGPAMAKGFTKSRTGTGRAVGLYFGVLDTALQDQWRFMTMGPVIRDMDRITRNKDWRKAYTQAFGPEYYRELRAWLKYTARPVTEPGDKLDSFINNQRKLATIFTLGLNTSTFIRQFQGYFQAVPDLGAKWILKGISRAAHNPMELVRYVNEQSPFMADRDKNFVRELRKRVVPPNDILKVTVGDRTYTREDVQEVAMTLVTLGDRLTSHPIWQGAYIKATESLNMNHDEAVAFANGLVQKTQASNTEADLNRWQREDGKSWKRLFSMFMSEALRKGSRMRYYWRAYQRNNIGIGEYMQHLCMETVAPAIFYVGMWAMLTSNEPEPEEIAEQMFGELTGPLPFISQLWTVVSYKYGAKSMMDSPAFRGIKLIEGLLKNVKKTAERPTNSKAHADLFKSLVDVAAFSLGTGDVRRMWTTAAQGWEDMERGKTANPFRLFFRPKR